jgi:hypothetical protein
MTATSFAIDSELSDLQMSTYWTQYASYVATEAGTQAAWPELGHPAELVQSDSARRLNAQASQMVARALLGVHLGVHLGAAPPPDHVDPGPQPPRSTSISPIPWMVRSESLVTISESR